MVEKEKEDKIKKNNSQETVNLRGLRERSSNCSWDPGSIWKELWYQEADHLAENEQVKGLGTSIKTRGMFRGNATLREMN